jgi:hypothetical protein
MPVIVLLTPPDGLTVVTVEPATFPWAFSFPLAERLPPALTFPATVSLPVIFIALPLWVMIELVTAALPPLVAKTGTEPALQAVPEEQTISLGWSAWAFANPYNTTRTDNNTVASLNCFICAPLI